MNKPEFNDEFAKIKRREHKTFGGKTVEIIYGAQDENGKPIPSKDGADDGHGTWSGIEVNGDYRMFVWTHSKAEGGATEYGTDQKENALNAMEADVLKRRDLARRAEIISREGNSDENEVSALKAEWDAIAVWNVPCEADYIKRFDKAYTEIGPRIEQMKINTEAKQKIVAEIEKLTDAENFRNARNELDKLKDQFREIGSAGSENDDTFHDTIRTVETTIRTKQKEFNDNLSENRSAAETKKNELIKQAKNLVSNVSNYKDTNTKLNTLFDQWKAAGSAGHETDEKLWTDFNTLRQEFYDARQKFFDDRNEQLKKSADAKQTLIEDAKKIVEKKDYGKQATDRMKQLDKEWREAGYSGKDQNDALWNSFTEIKETFWDAKKQIFTKAVEADVKKAETERDGIKKQIEDLEYRLTVVPNPSMKKDVEDELYVKKNELSDKEEQIEALKKKVSE